MPRPPSGFTLIELLVSISIIAILIAIAVPTIAAARQTAQRTAGLAHLRQLHVAIDGYKHSNRDLYPFPIEGRPYPTCDEGLTIAFSRWDSELNWPWLVQDVAPWREWRPVMLAPGALKLRNEPQDCGAPPSYAYSQTFTAAPELWGDAPLTDIDRFIRPVAGHEVIYTAAKVLLWDWEAPYLPRPRRDSGGTLLESVPTLFADGHAARHVPADALPPRQNQATPTVPPKPLRDTSGGVRGRDY